MKIIISSLYLKNGIEKAINNKPIDVEINSHKILFNCEGLSIEVEIHKESVRDAEDFKVKFDFMQWIKVIKYLKMLPEQPIVCEFLNYQYDELRIEIKNAEAVFNP